MKEDVFLKHKPKSYSDVHLLQREWHNRNKFTVKFVRDKSKDFYILGTGKNLGPEIAFCKPDELLYLPHGYYTIFGVGVPDGEPVEMLMNLEKAMFKGNKIPSNHYGLGE
jgi:hypothetical protein